MLTVVMVVAFTAGQAQQEAEQRIQLVQAEKSLMHRCSTSKAAQAAAEAVAQGLQLQLAATKQATDAAHMRFKFVSNALLQRIGPAGTCAAVDVCSTW